MAASAMLGLPADDTSGGMLFILLTTGADRTNVLRVNYGGANRSLI